MPRSLRLTCVTKRMPHHGAHAGYSALLQHLCPAHVVQVPTGQATRWLGAATRRLNLGRPPGSDWWGLPSLVAEMQGVLRSGGRPGVLHLMYGEDLLGVSSYLASNKRRVVATFHQPMSRIEALRVPLSAVRKLDALIVLDEASAEAWRQKCPGLQVHALRLGVDTDFWSPPARPQRRRSVLVVGGHLRDLEVLTPALTALVERGVQVDLVGVPPRWAEGLSGLSGVQHHVRIDDEALKALYQSAGAFLLALKAVSGNNALLQALATGCPVVATDLAGLRSYVGPEAAQLVAPGLAQGYVDAVIAVLHDATGAQSQVNLGLQRAQQLSLKALAAQHWAIYRGLI